MRMNSTDRAAYIAKRVQEGASQEQLYSDLINIGAGMDSSIEAEIKSAYSNVTANSNSVTNSYGENNFADQTRNNGLQTETANSLIGNNDLFSMKGLFGDGSSTGVLQPAFNGYMAYQKMSMMGDQLEETKRMNLAKEQAMKDANMMLGIEKENVVKQANRYAAIGAGNSNSQSALVRNMANTQYRNPNPYSRVG